MRRFWWFFLIYAAFGVVFAISRDQLTNSLMIELLEALLYILLWPLSAVGLIPNINL
jgi:uncharacterized membrane protein YhaH (DUF805 family)